MRHLWILNHYAQEPGGAGGTRHFHLAEYIKAHGWEVTIIAASVDHGTGLQRLEEGELFRHETIHGVSFLWLRTPEYSGNGVGRIRNMLSFTLRVLKRASTNSLPRPDAIIGSSVHPFAAWAGARLANRHKVPFIFEVRDLWPQTLIDMGRLKTGSVITWGLRYLERWLYDRAARIVVVLPHAHEYIVPMGIHPEKIVWIPNGVDLSLYPSPAAPWYSRDFTLMYFGGHGQANGLDNLLNAMKELKRNDGNQHIKLRLIGAGSVKPQLLKKAAELGLSNVSFEPPVPKSQIPRLAAKADAFVILVLDLPGLYKYGISMNKLYDYLAAMRPIIIASDASYNPVQDANAGMTVKPCDPHALADAIQKMASLPVKDREQMGRSGREYVELNHSFDQLAHKLARTLDAVLGSGLKK